MSTDTGWRICDLCGSIIGDTWTHAQWHETTLAALITEIATDALPRSGTPDETPVDTKADTPTTAPTAEETI